jgi:hypothetical protein
VTTLRVTVDGVTATAPLVVSQPFTLTAPAVVGPGSSVTATTTFPNTGPAALSNVRMSLTGPAGWTVTAISPASFATVAPGQAVQATWSVAAPANATPGSYPLSASVTFTGQTGQASSDDATQIAIPFASFTSAIDNVGISDDNNPTAGNLDGGGASYSAQALAAAGLTPGATVTHDGLTFTWPNAQPGTPDNVVAGGQTIAVSGSGSTLGLLGAGDYGTAGGTATITYSDGSTQPFDLTFPDWWSNTAPPGGDILATVPYINTPTGKENQGGVSVYYVGVPLQKGKTVKYVSFPDISQGVVQGQNAMHIFALSIG